MSFRIKHRYGDREYFDEIDRTTAKELVDELIEEQFDEPDLEHQQVTVRHSDGTYFTIFKTGYAQIEPAAFDDPTRWFKPYPSVDAILDDIETFVEKSIEITTDDGWVSDRKLLELPEKSPLF